VTIKTTGFLDSCLVGYCQKNTTFRKLDLFPSPGGGIESYVLRCDSERSTLTRWTNVVFIVTSVATFLEGW